MSDKNLTALNTELPKQFLVTRERLEPPPGWHQTRLGAFHVYRSPGVGWTRIVTPHCEPGGEAFVLGWFGHRDKFYPANNPDKLMVEGSLETIYPDMTGRFVVLRLQGDGLLCTTDAGAQMPVVYRPETSELGSTPGVLSWTMALLAAPQTAEDFSRTDGTLWYPFGATPYAGIERLLPGKTVSLGPNSAAPSDWRPANSIPRDVPGMHEVAGNFIHSLYSFARSLECHLTAGWDSRMVLSASWPLRDRIAYITYLADNTTARVDGEVADQIARRFHLAHERIPVSSPSEEEVGQWIDRTSSCIRDSVAGLTKTIVETDQYRYGLAGVGGEVGRAFYWKKRDIDAIGLTPEQLLQRLGFEKTVRALERADEWLEGYCKQSRVAILDRAYIDIRLGCWAGPALAGHCVEKPTLSPFNSLAIYESMLSLPETYRLNGSFARDFIAQGSRELACIPVNRRTGARRLQGLPRELARLLPKDAKALLRRRLSTRPA